METFLTDFIIALPGILFVVGYCPYIYDIVRKNIKPSKASWLIWAAMDAITFGGMYAEHTLNPLIVGALVGSVLTAILSIRFGKSGWNTIDKICLAGAALSLLLWVVFNSPLYGLLTALVVNFIGAIPTISSAWSHPRRESKLTWALFWIASALAIINIPHWTLADAAQPISFLAIQTIMVYLLFVKTQNNRKTSHARRA
ncbi:MAG: hypothetical protein WCK01_03355 [Candidatus Uhrbacteria bacterium]